MDNKKFIASLLEYAFFFVAFYWMRLPLHEWLHLTTLLTFGGWGYIEYAVFGAHVIIERMPTHPTIVAFSGGLGLGILFLIFLLWELHSENWEVVAAIIPQMTSELGYGTFEGLLLPVLGFFGQELTFEQFVSYSFIIGAASFFIGLAYSLYFLLPHIVERKKEEASR